MLESDFIEKSFEKFAKAVVKQARSNLTRGGHKASGDLYKSLDQWKIKVMPNSISLSFEMEDYAVYQDKGVKGSDPTASHKHKEPTPYKYTSKMPPFPDLRKWVGQKRFQFRDRQTGKFKSYDETARLIQRSIYRKGIPQTLFFTKPFRRNFDKLPEEIIEAFGKDVDRFLTAVFESEKKRLRGT